MVLLPLRRPAPPRQPLDPGPLEPRRKELEATPAGSAPFALEPFLQAVEEVAEQEGAEALGSLQWSLLGRPRLRGMLQDGQDAAVEPTGAEPARSDPALPLRKPLAGAEPGVGGSAVAATAAPPALGAGEPLAGAQRGRLESAFADSFPEVRLHHGREAARLSRSLGARAFTYGSDVMARLWGREVLGTVDLPAPQPLSRSGLTLSACSRRRREVPTGTGVHLDVGELITPTGATLPPPTPGLTAAIPGLTVNETADREQVLANMASSGVGSVYIFFGHGALPAGATAAVGVNPESGSTVMGPDIEAGLAAGEPRTGLNPCSPPTLVILGGCASASLLPGVNAAGTLAGNAVRIFMERLQAGDSFAQSQRAADIAAQGRVNPFAPSVAGENAVEAGFHLVVVRFRDGTYNDSMTLPDAQARHRSEAAGCR